MRNVGSLVAAVALVTALLPVPIASGQMAGAPYRLRLDGYVGPPPEGRRERADLLIRAGSKDVRFQVTQATVLSGNIKASTIFSRVRPFRPNLLLRGPNELVAKVADAAPGDRLRIVGTWRSGSRNLGLVTVEPQAAAALSPPAAH